MRARLPNPSPLWRCIAALGSVAVATLVRKALGAVAEPLSPFFTYYIAVAFTAWFAGLIPALLSLALSTLAAAWFFLPSQASLGVTRSTELANLWFFTIVGLANITLTELLRDAQRTAADRAAEAVARSKELEGEVEERRRAETALREREETQRDFAERLVALHEVSNALAAAPSFDELCRRAIELGHARLGFDRLGIWYFAPGGSAVTGSFGIDESGELRDERGARIDVSPRSLAGRVLAAKQPLALREHEPVLNHRGEKVGEASHAIAALWNGEEVTGFISTDTLLTHAPVTDEQCRLLTLYATVLGHLCSLKVAEEALRENEDRLRLALEAGSMGVWDWNLHTNALNWSDNLEPIHGFAPGTFDGTFAAFQAIIHPDDRERVNAAITEALTSRSRYEAEFRICWPDGSTHWMSGRGAVFCDAEGQPLRMVGTGMDITSRKQAELEIARLAAIVESSEDAIIGKTLEGIITDWNAGAEHLYGYTAAEVVGQPISLLVPPESKEDVPEVLVRIRRGERVTQYETVRMRKDGQRLQISLTVSPIVDRAGQITGAAMIARDITARKRLEAALQARAEQIETQNEELQAQYEELQVQNEELASQDRHRNEFLAMLAHELRNPLAPMVAAVEVLRLRTPDDPALERQRQVIERQARHLARLVDDLLDVSRVTQGKIALQKELVELTSLVEQAIQICRALVDERGHELTVTLPPEPLWLEADPTRVVQILCNLVNNAARYTESPGRIELGVARAGDEAVIRVRDDGRGIPPELLPRIFDLFVQGERSLARSEGGLGIGLTLVQSLVEQHGGTVTVQSAGSGEGSEFIVRFPIAGAARLPAGHLESPLPPAAAAGADHGPPGRRVLLVEDNADAAETLAELIRRWGHAVNVCADGRAALAAAADFRPHVVVLDIGLPGMDGYEVARRLQQEKPSTPPLLVAVTGYGHDEARRRSEEAGFHHHLTKPVQLTELRRLIESAPGDVQVEG
jgi:PAS domain S-box-containing protein